MVFELQDYLDHHWQQELISYPMAEPGEGSLCAVDESGQVLPAQYSAGRVYLMTDLLPLAHKRFEVKPAAGEAVPETDLTVERAGDIWEINTAQIGLRLPAGEKTFDSPLPLEQASPPLLSVRGAEGVWRGGGALAGEAKVCSWSAELLEEGPLFATVRIRYELEPTGYYEVRIQVIAHQEVTLVWEDFSLPQEGALELAWSEGWEPTHGLWGPHSPAEGRGAPPEWRRGSFPWNWNYPLDQGLSDPVLLSPFFAWDKDVGTYWGGFGEGEDYFAVLALSPTQWRNPMENRVQVFAHGERGVVWRFPLSEGTRHWLLHAGVKSKCVPPNPESNGGGTSGGAYAPGHHAGGLGDYPQACRSVRTQRLGIKFAETPLDQVKDFVLQWEGARPEDYPRGLCRREEIPEIRERLTRNDFLRDRIEKHGDDSTLADPAGLYLATGDEKYAQAAKEGFLGILRNLVDSYLTNTGFMRDQMVCMHLTRPLRAYALGWDLIAGSDVLTPDERNWANAVWTFAIYKLLDPDAWPEQALGYSRANENFHSDRLSTEALVVNLLTGHPRQREWAEAVAAEMEADFERSTHPGGSWIETPNYHVFSLYCLMAGMIALNNGGLCDLSTNQRFQETMDFLVRVQAPYDPRLGTHSFHTIGDTPIEKPTHTGQAVYAIAAKLLAETDPDLSAHLMWAWEGAGRPYLYENRPGELWSVPLAAINADLPAQPPEQPLTSEYLPGFGAILRNNWNTERESYFLWKMGPCRSHYQCDEGTFHWFAYGQPLCLDFGQYGVVPMTQNWLHSRLSVEHRNARDEGRVARLSSLPPADLAEGEVIIRSTQPMPENECPQWSYQEPFAALEAPLIWRRSILFMRDPDAVVLLDTTQGENWTDWTLWTLAESLEIEGNHVRLQGQQAINLDVWMGQPSPPDFATAEWSHDGGAGRAKGNGAAWMTEPPREPIGEKQLAIRCQAVAGGSYSALLFPTVPGEEVPQVEIFAGGYGYHWRRDGEEAVAILLPQTQEITDGDFSLNGRAALAKVQGDAITLSLNEGQTMAWRGYELQGPGPLSATFRDHSIEGVFDGPARRVLLRAPQIAFRRGYRLQVDGQEYPCFIAGQPGSSLLLINFDAGRHEFTIEIPSENLP